MIWLLQKRRYAKLEKLNQEAKAKGYSYWNDRFITSNKSTKKKNTVLLLTSTFAMELL
jgi:antibiotic biosynthesis monooxygenase (ABM) superfamily enzyme